MRRRARTAARLMAGMALLATAKAWPARAEGSAAMKNVVLLGDSIFDNKSYVGAGPDVVDQLKGDLPSGWTATLVARDGSTTVDIKSQLKAMPPGRDPPGGVGRRQQRARREGHDRGERALGGRGARQARQDQGRVRQELRRHARRRAGAQAAGRGVHHLRGALRRTRPRARSRAPGSPCSTTSSCARRSPAACR